VIRFVKFVQIKCSVVAFFISNWLMSNYLAAYEKSAAKMSSVTQCMILLQICNVMLYVLLEVACVILV